MAKNDKTTAPAREAAPPEAQASLDPRIQFADEPPPPVATRAASEAKLPGKVLELDPRERNRANQRAASEAIERLKHADLDRDFPIRAQVAPKLTETEVAKLQAKRYRVLRRTEVPSGARRITLAQGKEISANDYDIPTLRRMGVELEEIAPVAG